MSRIRAPLLSWGASGQIAQTQVYAHWKGRPYVRQYVIPTNPRSVAQTQTRNAFKQLQMIYPYLPTDATASWDLYGENNRYTGRNGFNHINMPLIRGESDLNKLMPMIAAGGGIAPAGAVLVAGDQTLTMTLTAPELPPDWSITRAFGVAITSVDPNTPQLPQVVGATSTGPTYELDFTGLTNGVEYVVGGAFLYQKADGHAAYGAPAVDTETPVP